MLRLNCLLTVCVMALVINVDVTHAVGRGGSSWHGVAKHGVARHGGGYWGGYGGYGGYGFLYYGTPQYYAEPVVDVSAPQPLGPVVPTSFVLGCKHNHEIKTVPSEDGGTRQITITRC
jgi:hypothetical protein